MVGHRSSSWANSWRAWDSRGNCSWIERGGFDRPTPVPEVAPDHPGHRRYGEGQERAEAGVVARGRLDQTEPSHLHQILLVDASAAIAPGDGVGRGQMGQDEFAADRRRLGGVGFGKGLRQLGRPFEKEVVIGISGVLRNLRPDRSRIDSLPLNLDGTGHQPPRSLKGRGGRLLDHVLSTLPQLDHDAFAV